MTKLLEPSSILKNFAQFYLCGLMMKQPIGYTIFYPSN